MRTLIALSVAALIAAPALAQPPGGGRGGMRGAGGGAQLLSVEDVQKELKLTDEQKTKIKDFQTTQQKAMQELRAGGGQPDREKMQEFIKKVQEDSAKFLKDTLTDEQSKRFKQIGLQQSLKNNPSGAFFTMTFGPDGPAMGDATETGKALKITDDQKEKIKSVSDQLRKDSADLRQPGQRPSADDQKKLDALRKEANEKIMETLTDEQRKSLKELQGAPFEGKLDAAPGGRRPGAGGAGAGGRRGNPGAGATKPEDKKPEDKKPADKKDDK